MVQLKPLMEQLNRVKDLKVPEFGSLQAWEAQASAAGHAGNGDNGSNDPSKSSHGLGYSGAPMPFLGETKVEVAFAGEGKEEDVKSENASTSLKVLLPWMIKQGMNLTKEQRGEVKQETKVDGSSAAVPFSDDKKTVGSDDQKNVQACSKITFFFLILTFVICGSATCFTQFSLNQGKFFSGFIVLQDEYVKAYYAALLKKQQEMAEAANKQPESSSMLTSDGSGTSSNRQVGMKSKHDEDEPDDDVDWEDAPIAGNTNEGYKVGDLNVEAEASGGDDDDVDWEEG